VQDGIIEPREAYLKAVDKLSLEQKFSSAGIKFDKTASEISKVNADGTVEMASADMNSPDRLKEKAWKLSTDRNSQARDGRKALELIQRAIELGANDSETLMILAAAQAETGEFKLAVETVRKAMSVAKQEHNKDGLRELDQQLSFYKKAKPHPGAVA
jgi:Flp pilus assembly protein TadD